MIEKIIKFERIQKMNELIPVKYDNDNPTVSARDLHEFLEVGTHFKDWFPRMCEYGFEENTDYTPLIFEHPQNKQETKDYVMTIPMAKEIAMLQRNAKGKKARQYFIKIEEAWNTPEQIMARALKMASRTIDSLKLENKQKTQIIGELQPKANYVDTILANPGLVTITQIAKDYGMSGQKMNSKLAELGVQFKQSNQWLLYAKYHDKGYTHSKTIPIERSDGRPDIVMETKWTQKGRLFIYELLKREEIYPTIETSQFRSA